MLKDLELFLVIGFTTGAVYGLAGVELVLTSILAVPDRVWPATAEDATG